MIQKITDFFTGRLQQATGDENVQGENRLAMATCALLLEMAHADSEFTEEEQGTIISAIQKNFDVSAQDAEMLIELADQERKESLDLWQFTSLINKNFKHDEKIRVLEILWTVIYSDGKVDMHEEYLMRKLSYLLELDHSEMIETKLKVREGKPE